MAAMAAGSAGLAGKVALVTGAAGAIGAAVSRDLAAAGVKVALLDYSAEGLKGIAGEIGAELGLALPCDLASSEAIAAAVKALKEAWGMPDILVNVAGILSNNKLAETTVDEWNRVMNINSTSAFLLCQHCCPAMAAKKWGRVVNVTSWAWKSGGLTAGTAYSVSKGAMTALTFSVARQYADQGITCNGIAPCYVFSPMIMEQLSAEKRAELLDTIPVKKFCTPEEVAHTTNFLVSPLAGFITGEIIDQNGGFQMD